MIAPRLAEPPGRLHVSHGPDEFIDEKAMRRCAAVYARRAVHYAGPIGHTGAMGATYDDDDWRKDLTDEPADELDDNREESWLLDDELPLDADEPE